MSRRGPRALSLYLSTPDPLPPASVEARIMAAARAAPARAAERGHLLFLGALAATVMISFAARSLIGDPPLPDSREYGLAEGQSRTYLLTFDPLTTGPGSQEGLP